jgi:hypothetical protein
VSDVRRRDGYHVLRRLPDPDVDDYYCPECGRRVVYHYGPYKQTVIAAGDDLAIHTTEDVAQAARAGLLNLPDLRAWSEGR